ncbi:MAG: ribosome biogenesis GTP-binding protein YihA/YsxC [Clostridiales bacterium]|nr:ribosome biogenesis GTP-binding protein YihA/YsxC [Clostridiales bacterium]
MIVKSAELETVCGITSKLPDNKLPEIAFAGKSNVGKSSLINSLLCRKSLARTSAQPGKTQTINFYNINKELYFVDLPGYGYAKVSVEIRAKWGKMIEKYLHTSGQLKKVFLLIDIRHVPSENDCMMYDWIVDNGYDPVIICTKLDKIKRSQVQKNLKLIREKLDLVPGTKMIPFSAQTKQGKDEIWDLIEGTIRDNSQEE